MPVKPNFVYNRGIKNHDIHESYAAAHMAALAKQEKIRLNPPWDAKKVCERIAFRASEILVQLANDEHTRAHKSYLTVNFGRHGNNDNSATFRAELRFPTTQNANQYNPYANYYPVIARMPSPTGLDKLLWRIHHAIVGDARFVERHALKFIKLVAVAEALHNSNHRMEPAAAVLALHEKKQIALAAATTAPSATHARSL